MEGKLNEEGNLEIKRGQRWVGMHCPFTGGPCGEWCPQLSEPMRQKNHKTGNLETVLYMCHGKHWKFSDFEDRRSV